MDNNPNTHKDTPRSDDVEPIFPPELIYDVLLRLPVKSLLRFKCVSKSFGAVIDSPEFKKMQLHTSSKKKLILKESTPRNQKLKTTAFYVYDMDGGLEGKTVFRNQQVNRLSMCGSVNGLILLFDEYSNYVLWNPSSDRHRNLPPCPLERNRRGGFYKCRMGLGYDSASDEYKVVLVHRGNTWIFRLKSNSWARIDPVFSPYNEHDLSFSASFAHGNIHWLYNSSTDGSQTIVAFDVAKELVCEVSFPMAGYYMTGLHVLGGCLCVSFFSRTSEEGAVLYVRKKDGDDYVWCKLYSVTSQLEELFFPIFCLQQVRVVGYSEGGNKILLDVGLPCMISYDLKEKSFDESDIAAEYAFVNMPTMCCESLVSVGDEAIACSTDRRRGYCDDTLLVNRF